MEDSLILRLQRIKGIYQINQWIKNLSPLAELIIVINGIFDHAFSKDCTLTGMFRIKKPPAKEAFLF